VVKDERLLAFASRIGDLSDTELDILMDTVQARIEALEAEREVAGDSAERFDRLLAWEKARKRLIKEEQLRRAIDIELPQLP
jgi:hypothetical protein